MRLYDSNTQHMSFNSLPDTHTKLQILCTRTALLFTMHTSTADSVHRDCVFVYYSARRTELHILFTGTALSLSSARDCIRCQGACAVFFVSEFARTHRKMQIMCTGTAFVYTNLRVCMRFAAACGVVADDRRT